MLQYGWARGGEFNKQMSLELGPVRGPIGGDISAAVKGWREETYRKSQPSSWAGQRSVVSSPGVIPFTGSMCHSSCATHLLLMRRQLVTISISQVDIQMLLEEFACVKCMATFVHVWEHRAFGAGVIARVRFCYLAAFAG
jgi:hypothetical protein